MPPQLTKYVSNFYERVHALDIKYTSVIYQTVQKYTVLRVLSKVIKVLSDGPAVPLFLLIYYAWENPSPFTFAAYVIFWVFYHELIIKAYFARRRPSTAGKQKGFSFPSSHSFSSGLIIVTCLSFAFPWTPFLIALAVINIINRPAVGVHYIADVIAGTILGLLAGFGWIFILRIAMVTLL